MLVKELKEVLQLYPDYIEVMIDNDGYLFDLSRTETLVNLDANNRIIAENKLDASFNEKEAVLVMSTF